MLPSRKNHVWVNPAAVVAVATTIGDDTRSLPENLWYPSPLCGADAFLFRGGSEMDALNPGSDAGEHVPYDRISKRRDFRDGDI